MEHNLPPVLAATVEALKQAGADVRFVSVDLDPIRESLDFFAGRPDRVDAFNDFDPYAEGCFDGGFDDDDDDFFDDGFLLYASGIIAVAEGIADTFRVSPETAVELALDMRRTYDAPTGF
jgi:hypothetical protein